ncbi:hypothetical protein [Paroceanicella profunda]|uniref:hypothetical protein n=1 Tax=Paroceanicella profunda TaxID=2579971 RepID=UPI0014793C24|nr:hypothetical protein [Paroceanicella profunda]
MANIDVAMGQHLPALDAEGASAIIARRAVKVVQGPAARFDALCEELNVFSEHGVREA